MTLNHVTVVVQKNHNIRIKRQFLSTIIQVLAACSWKMLNCLTGPILEVAKEGGQKHGEYLIKHSECGK